MIKMRRYIAVVIIVISVFSTILGIVFVSGSNGSHTGHTGGVSRASTSIEFGADFYTTSAQYSGLAANAATDIYTILSLVFFVFI